MCVCVCVYIYVLIFKDFPGGLDGKASVYNEGDPGLISDQGARIACTTRMQPKNK